MHGLSKHAVKVGGVLVVLYALCLLWKLTITDPAVVSFHETSLKLAFPGFKGYDMLSIVWGAVLSWVYGFAASVIWHRMHKDCCGAKTN